MSNSVTDMREEDESLTELIRKSPLPVSRMQTTPEMEKAMEEIARAGPGYFFESEEVSIGGE